MSYLAIRALVRNDLRIYLTDRRAMIIGVLVPILIAAFFGYIFGGNGDAEPGKIPVAIVDEDASVVSRAIVADFEAESLVAVRMLDRAQAEAGVRAGKIQVAAIIPKDFAAAATRALFTGQRRPQVDLWVDPSQAMSGRVVQGLFAEHGMQEITKEAFGGASGQAALQDFISQLESTSAARVPERAELKSLLEALRNLQSRVASEGGGATPGLQRGLSIPYQVAVTKITSAQNVPYNGYAHSFAGMTTQFILLAGIDAGIVLLLARERGIWQRLRSAPLGKAQFLLARIIATALISLFQFVLVYAAAVAIFRVRIGGSFIGFAALGVALCVLNASFGLMLAAIGRSAAATRGIAVLATLLLVMLGGAWVPSFVFPKWLQQVSLALPTRWAVDGLDAMTWRGLGLAAAIPPLLVLGATSALCIAVAIWRFRWEE
ncbi:MAG: ABC transporter permease [Steroidobacteraceae bacterium]